MVVFLRIIFRGCGIGVKYNRFLYIKLKNYNVFYLNFKRNVLVIVSILKKSFDYCYNFIR